MDVQELEEAERLTYANWMQRLRKEQGAIGILINADIALGEGFERLPQVLNTADSALALSRYNQQGEGKPARLNKFTHWTQDTWALRSDAPISDSLLYASSFPIGYPGCDNRIAYVLWSHGLVVKNPCYLLETLHHQADDNRHYDEITDRLYGGVSYVHPSLSLEEASELEHAIWTRALDECPGVLVNQQAVGCGQSLLLAQSELLAQRFLEQQKSTGLACEHPPLGCLRSAHASSWPVAQLLNSEGATLEIGDDRRLKGLQLRLSPSATGNWLLELEGQQQGESDWQKLEQSAKISLLRNGRRQFVELPVRHEHCQRLRLVLRQEPQTGSSEGLLEILAFSDKTPAAKAKQTSTAAQTQQSSRQGRTLRLQLRDRRLEPTKTLLDQCWQEIHRYSDRFVLQARDGRLAFVDRYWPTAVTFADPQLEDWDTQTLIEAFVWGFAGPVLEWKPQQFSTEKVYKEQLNFWQYPCRTEQEAFERHQLMSAPYWDRNGVHVYVGMPWATWIDKKTFPDQLLEAYRRRTVMMTAILKEPLQVHSVCQHIRWKEHSHRFEQAGINQLWIAHKEKDWDTEGRLRLHSWPLYPVNILEPNRQHGLNYIPVEQKTIFASFKGAYMQHYISDIRLRLKTLAELNGYSIEVSDQWHFNQIVYEYQTDNMIRDNPTTEYEEVVKYNRLLSESLFSLCPAGAGPNTLRFWESLGAGSIPVLLSDQYELPNLEFQGQGIEVWQQAIVIQPEAKLAELDERLRKYSKKRIIAMQSEGRRLFDISRRLRCMP